MNTRIKYILPIIFSLSLALLIYLYIYHYETDDFNQVKIVYKDIWKGNTNNRTVFIATPKKKRPENGWPYLIYLQFINQEGKLEWVGLQNYDGGVMVSKTVLRLLEEKSDTNFFNIQTVLRGAVNQGKKVICIGDFRDDYRFYGQCDYLTGTLSADDIINNLCWNNGDNPDVNIFNKLFDDLKTGVYPFDVDYNNMGVFGYSVGGQMISRIINSFPTMTTDNGNNYPNKIKYAIMLGGGSHRCYDYPDINNPPTTPINYIPCDNKSIQCCPLDYTEDIYNGTNVANRPPVLLLQTSNDKFADVNASTYYYNTVKNRLDVAGITNNIIYKNQYPNSDPKIINGTLHGMVDEQVNVAIDFLKRF